VENAVYSMWRAPPIPYSILSTPPSFSAQAHSGAEGVNTNAGEFLHHADWHLAEVLVSICAECDPSWKTNRLEDENFGIFNFAPVEIECYAYKV